MKYVNDISYQIYKNPHFMAWKGLNAASTVLNHPEPCKANADMKSTVWDLSSSWNKFFKYMLIERLFTGVYAIFFLFFSHDKHPTCWQIPTDTHTGSLSEPVAQLQQVPQKLSQGQSLCLSAKAPAHSVFPAETQKVWQQLLMAGLAVPLHRAVVTLSHCHCVFVTLE